MFILGTWCLNLRVLRLHAGRYAVSILVTPTWLPIPFYDISTGEGWVTKSQNPEWWEMGLREPSAWAWNRGSALTLVENYIFLFPKGISRKTDYVALQCTTKGRSLFLHDHPPLEKKKTQKVNKDSKFLTKEKKIGCVFGYFFLNKTAHKQSSFTALLKTSWGY